LLGLIVLLFKRVAILVPFWSIQEDIVADKILERLVIKFRVQRQCHTEAGFCCGTAWVLVIDLIDASNKLVDGPLNNAPLILQADRSFDGV
jgi:hypothetical protein